MAQGPPIRVIERSDLAALLSLDQCIEVIDACMRQVSLGSVELPLRWGVPVGKQGAMGMMPGYLGEPACFGIKLVSLFPDNPAHGFSSHAGLVVLFEPEFGQPIALMDAGYLTALRTAAASAVATRALARVSASTVAILGTGEQAQFHAKAMLAVRDVRHMKIYGRTPDKARALVDELRPQLPGVAVKAAASVAAAIKQADIICTATAANEPILFGDDVPVGCHVNAVGASNPASCEIDVGAVTRSRYYVDYRPSALAQAAELIKAIDQGRITETDICGEIGEVLLGQCPGRQTDREITFYRSLGVAAQDLAAAHYIYEKATELDVGSLARI